MVRSMGDVLDLQLAVGRHWMATVLAVVDAYAALLDPRPDLAVPPRTADRPHWWWS